MNFDEAMHAHVRWSLQFKNAIEGEEMLDVSTISAADRCDLGEWLHGEAQAKYSTRNAYLDCLAKHTRLHRVAGRLAQMINEGDYAQAETMLHDGSAYTEASIELGTAITSLRAEVG